MNPSTPIPPFGGESGGDPWLKRPAPARGSQWAYGSPPPRLDRGTQLVNGVLYEGAREAVIWASRPALEEYQPERTAAVELDDRQAAAMAEPQPADSIADQPDEHLERSLRRSRGRVRRYAVHNGCSRLLTLTYAPPQPTDARVVLRDVQAFQRALGAAYPALAWVRVFERHKSGALHVHVIASGPVPKGRLARLWGHGFVDVRRLGRPGESARAMARAGARYAAKYIGKGAIAESGDHRYEVRQGFQPEAVRVRGWTDSEVWTDLVRAMGGELPAYEWESSTATDWRGPPVRFLAWD
jgi:hypothetical protein